MELTDARHTAARLLEKVIEHQENVLLHPQGVSGISGEAAALFCEKFIETYAAYLVRRTQ